MYAPDRLRSSSDVAKNIPLFHVFTFHKDIAHITNPKERREARQKEIASRIELVLEEKELKNECDVLCGLDEKLGCYFYLGHLYQNNCKPF